MVINNNIKLYGYSNSENSFSDKYNIEFLHEQFFFEDEIGGNIGFFGDGLLKEDKIENLSKYKYIDNNYYEDSLLREAIKNVEPKEYQLLDINRILGFGSDTQYNCQDWVQEVKNEYKILKQQNIGK